MFSSATLRRWAGISVEGAKCFSRAIQTATRRAGVSPWLMLPPAVDGIGNIDYKFRSLVDYKELTYTNKIGGGEGELELPVDVDIVKDVKFVGSSHGWLALQNRRNYENLFLSNPITGRHIKLPPPPASGASGRLILSAGGDIEADGCLARMTYSDKPLTLAFCSPLRSKEWTLLNVWGGGDGRDYYDNIVYSTTHHRLFCAIRYSGGYDVTGLECWDLNGNPPRRDWVIHQRKSRWPVMSEFKERCHQVRYLVCSGEVLLLVVRHVNIRAGPHGSMVDEVMLSPDMGCLYTKTPYKTIDFDVYRIDPERGLGEVELMERSLGGLAIFVGINEPFAIRAAKEEVGGVRPDCVYFTEDNHPLAELLMVEGSCTYGGHDNGIFDYKNKDFYSCCDVYPIEYERIRKILPLPLWFTPTTTL
ncbi:hypothetical protein OROGR_033102 [Orobanche gracilis]